MHSPSTPTTLPEPVCPLTNRRFRLRNGQTVEIYREVNSNTQPWPFVCHEFYGRVEGTEEVLTFRPNGQGLLMSSEFDLIEMLDS